MRYLVGRVKTKKNRRIQTKINKYYCKVAGNVAK